MWSVRVRKVRRGGGVGVREWMCGFERVGEACGV